VNKGELMSFSTPTSSNRGTTGKRPSYRGSEMVEIEMSGPPSAGRGTGWREDDTDESAGEETPLSLMYESTRGPGSAGKKPKP